MKIYSWNVNGIRAVVRKGEFGLSWILTRRMSACRKRRPPAARPSWICPSTRILELGRAQGFSGTAIFSREKPISTMNDFADGISAEFGLTADEYGDPMREGGTDRRVRSSSWSPPTSRMRNGT
ncbi:MAG: hypothetical protein M9938_04825 [Solirubrobacterales bacterium]|nr:hypothetical protein [Solirubrobacterales bacterium]